MTSSALAPIEPVAPSTAIVFMGRTRDRAALCRARTPAVPRTRRRGGRTCRRGRESSVPESFTPAWRLIRLSKRSPTIEAMTVISASADQREPARGPRRCSSQPPIAASRRAAGERAVDAGDRLVRADLRAELRLAVAAAGEIRGRCRRPRPASSRAAPRPDRCCGSACSLVSATHAGNVARSPATSLIAAFSRVGAAPNEKFRSHRNATIHHAPPAASTYQISGSSRAARAEPARARRSRRRPNAAAARRIPDMRVHSHIATSTVIAGQCGQRRRWQQQHRRDAERREDESGDRALLQHRQLAARTCAEVRP